MTGEMQQQQIVRSALRKQVLDLPLDDMRGFVPHYLHGKAADLGIAEHPAERLGIGARGQQVAQRLLLVLVVGDDQGFPLAANDGVSSVVCLPMKSLISRS
jgi:hypothetical protein